MTACAHCGNEVEARFRFCPWCGVAQRRKLVEFFRPHPNSLGRALRVSRYYGEEPQVRFSVWDDGVAAAAVSLGEDETRRLAGFLAATAVEPATGPVPVEQDEAGAPCRDDADCDTADLPAGGS